MAALRVELAQLRAEKADLINELANRDDALVAAESEIDALRHVIGDMGVPL